MLEIVRSMPNGVRVFLLYGFVVLALIGMALPGIISLAVEIPISGPGLVAMLLLAYTVFTLTLVLQRKRAAYGLALGLSSLTVPLLLFLLLIQALGAALVAAAVAGTLFYGLTRPASRGWFDRE